MSLCMFDGFPEAGRELHSTGYLIYWHWLEVIVMTTKGHSMNFYCSLEVEPCITFYYMS